MNSPMQMLADRMASGRIQVGEALRIGTAIADELRQLHEQGTVHGALSPGLIELTDSGVQLYGSPEPGATTRYTAPEVAAGGTADARSDIFSFGAIFYELLTGRAAFEDGSQATAPSGSPAVDRLMRGCVAASPDARFQRIQKLMLELRLLSNAARRGGSAPAPAAAPPARAAAPAPGAASSMSDLERRIAARMEEQERSMASVAQVANEVLKALREQQQPRHAPSRQPLPSHTPMPRLHSRSFFSSALEGHPEGRIERAIDEIADRIARLDLVVGSAVERLQKLEQNLDAFDTDAAALRDSVTRDIRNFERLVKAQSTAIESARTAMGQTDDLVERVVEALDSLQSMFVNTSDERSLAS
jgi:serine/threonine protein kinase